MAWSDRANSRFTYIDRISNFSQEKMPQYTLHYFNVRGLAELCRMIFAQAGQEYTDHRIASFEEWAEHKKNSE